MSSAAYNPANAYQRSQVGTARPEEVLLQLVEAAVRHAREVQRHGDAEDRTKAKAREHAVKLLDIVCHLNESLDHDNGGELVDELDALYAFLIREISEANRKAEFERFADVETILRTLYQGWKDAVAEVKGQANQATAPAAVGSAI